MNKDDNSVLTDALVGAGVTSSLPLLTHAKYELIDRPRYRRQIEDIVAKAKAEGKLFAAPADQGYREFVNPLQRRMRQGDVILQSHNGVTFREMLKDKMPDFTTMSLGGSGSGVTHAAVATSSGRSIDPGKDELTAFKDGIIKLLLRPRNILSRERFSELSGLRRIHPRSVADKKYIRRNSVDAFESAFLRPNVSVVLRPNNATGVSKERVAQHLADLKSVGYSSTDAAAAALKRMLLPLGPFYKPRNASDLRQGTFCSNGACSIQALHGMKTPKLSSVLPPDLLHLNDQSLVGIGVNRGSLDAIRGSGLRGQNRLAAAAKNTMLNTLKTGVNTRRLFAGLLTSSLAGLGALGGVIGNKVEDKIANAGRE